MLSNTHRSKGRTFFKVSIQIPQVYAQEVVQCGLQVKEFLKEQNQEFLEPSMASALHPDAITPTQAYSMQSPDLVGDIAEGSNDEDFVYDVYCLAEEGDVEADEEGVPVIEVRANAQMLSCQVIVCAVFHKQPHATLSSISSFLFCPCLLVFHNDSKLVVGHHKTFF
jgi:hypothetical protein